MNDCENIVILEKNIKLNQEEEKLFNIIKSSDFPFYYQTTTSANYHMYGHTLMSRDSKEDIKEGQINSDCYIPINSFFKKICEENNINVKTIYRSAINSTHYYDTLYCDPHKDHEFNHYVFLMYINKFDNGFTYIFDENKNIKNIIYPSENKIVIFKNALHAHGFCNIGQRRLVLVITFDIE